MLDSRLNQALSGVFVPMTVVVFPMQYLADVVHLVDMNCAETDQTLVLASIASRISKKDRERVLSRKIVFVSQDLVPLMKRILK